MESLEYEDFMENLKDDVFGLLFNANYAEQILNFEGATETEICTRFEILIKNLRAGALKLQNAIDFIECQKHIITGLERRLENEPHPIRLRSNRRQSSHRRRSRR